MLLDITHEAMVVLVAQYMVMQFTLLHEISNPSQWSCEKNSQKMHFLMQQKQASLHLLVFLLASMRKGQLTDIHMQLAFLNHPNLPKNSYIVVNIRILQLELFLLCKKQIRIVFSETNLMYSFKSIPIFLYLQRYTLFTLQK